MKFSTTATVVAAALAIFSNPSEARIGGWNGAAAQGAAMIISGFNGGQFNGPSNGGYRPPPSNYNAPIVRPAWDEDEDLYDEDDFDDEDESIGFNSGLYKKRRLISNCQRCLAYNGPHACGYFCR